MRQKYIVGAMVVIVVSVISIYVWRENIQRIVTYGFGVAPAHEPGNGCFFERKTLKNGLSLFVKNCPGFESLLTRFENSDGSFVETSKDNPNYKFIIQLLHKDKNQNALNIVKEWYSKLTLEQQSVCEIQNADQPIRYFKDGRVLWTEEPHPTAHKTRYKIDVKPEIINQIFAKFGGDPGGGPERDYMCGHLVGSAWGMHSPYFEFDDRSPEKYLLVGSYGEDGPEIDLNSIRF